MYVRRCIYDFFAIRTSPLAPICAHASVCVHMLTDLATPVSSGGHLCDLRLHLHSPATSVVASGSPTRLPNATLEIHPKNPLPPAAGRKIQKSCKLTKLENSPLARANREPGRSLNVCPSVYAGKTKQNRNAFCPSTLCAL